MRNVIQAGAVLLIAMNSSLASPAVPPAEIHALAIARNPIKTLLAPTYRLVLDCPSAPGSWITDQETVLSATNAKSNPQAFEADDASLSLPEGSSLKAVLDSDRIVTERFSDRTRYTLHGGEVRIVDAKGTVRVRVWVDDAILRLDATVENDEVNFHVRGLGVDGHYLPVRIHVNPDSSNGDLSHGAVRWKVLQPDESGKPFRLKMQFVYDQHKLCETKRDSPE